MIFEKNHKQWENAHMFYDDYKRNPIASSKNVTEDYFWRKKILNSPNGELAELTSVILNSIIYTYILVL